MLETTERTGTGTHATMRVLYRLDRQTSPRRHHNGSLRNLRPDGNSLCRDNHNIGVAQLQQHQQNTTGDDWKSGEGSYCCRWSEADDRVTYVCVECRWAKSKLDNDRFNKPPKR